MVLGLMIERYMHISFTLYGQDFLLQRPISLGLLALVLLSLIYPFVRKTLKARKQAKGV